LQCTLPQQDCGGTACVSTERDVNNCGTCGLVCATPQHATSKCEASKCGFTCNPGFFQCASQGCCPASALAAGGDTTCAVVEGSVDCWGANDFGQLGQGGTPSATGAPGPVTVIGAVTSLSAGTGFTCAVFAGNVYCWGTNSSYQFGESSPPAMSATPLLVNVSAPDTAV